MTPDEREEALERREANAALLMAKLEKDRVALEADIAASAAASKAASAITRALHSDALKKAKEVEGECAKWEAKLARLKLEASKMEAVISSNPARSEQEIEREKAALAAARIQHEADRVVLDADKAAFLRESTEARAKLKAEAQALADLRTKLVAIRGEIEGGVKLREAEVRKKEALIEAERAKLQASADALVRAEAEQSEERAKLEAQIASLAAKEVMFEERHRQLQERLKNFAKA